uniref:Uncharacterized protein n=1 Tax=Erpetoichthys calabaricus TaxID=27687 RepID=A0A8C4RW78_ERPCA
TEIVWIECAANSIKPCTQHALCQQSRLLVVVVVMVMVFIYFGSVNTDHSLLECYEIMWTFLMYLESVSISTHYLFFLGLYWTLYLANLIWLVSGMVQTIFYHDFSYLYFTKVLNTRITRAHEKTRKSVPP